MQRVSKRVMSWLLTLAVIVSMIPSALAAGNSNNTAVRHKVATSLSTQAQAYYTGNDSIDNLYKLQGDSSGKSYNGMSSPLYKELQSLMERTMTATISYTSLTTYWKTTDTDSRGYNCFYGDAPESSPNREHVWPKSRGSFYQSYAGADLHHLRPTNTNINSTRGNMTMGNVRAKYPGNYSTASFAGNTVLYYNSSSADLVEVNDNIKGDVARIYLYVYVRWAEPNLFENVPSNQLPPPRGGSDTGGNNGLRVIDNLDTLLQWCQNDPVDEWEMKRNDLTQDVQHNRNVFIDYPELAWKLFDRPIPAGMPTPSGGKGGVELPDPKYTVNVFPETPGTGTVSYASGIITATPAEGYYTAGASVSPAGTATVTQSSNLFVVSNVTANCTILVNFAPKQSASIGYALPEGVTTDGPIKGYLGDSITLPSVTGAPADSKYTFIGWVDAPVTATSDSSSLTVLDPGQSYMVTKQVTKLYALYSYRVDGGTGTANTFTLVKSAQPDWSGDYILTSPDADFIADGTTKADGSVGLSSSGITKAGDTLTNNKGKYIISITKVGNNYSMQLKDSATPLYYAYSGSSNSLATATNTTGVNAQWKLSYSAGSTVIESVATSGRVLRFNNGLFRCYAGTQQPIELYAASGSSTTYYLTLSEGGTVPDPDPIPAVISYAAPDGVTVVSGPTTGEVGKSITLPNVSGSPKDTTKAYTFAGWVDVKVTDTTTKPTVYAAGTSYIIKSAAIKLYALYSYSTTEAGGGGDTYTLVKGGTALAAGDKIVVATKNLDTTKQYKDEPTPDQPRNSYYALGAQKGTGTNTYREAVKVTKDGDTLAIAPGVEEITLVNGVNTGTFALKMSTGNYLFALGTANYVGEEASPAARSSWSIVASAEGSATIKASEGDASLLRYNVNTDPNTGATTGISRFSAYKSSSSTALAPGDINIYKKSAGSGSTIDVTHYLTLSEGGPVIPVDPKPDPEPDPIPAAIGYSMPNGVTIPNDAVKVSEVGKNITLPGATPATIEVGGKTHTFEGWVDAKLDPATTTAPTIYQAGASYKLTKAATEFFALYSYTTTVEGGGTEYRLVTNADSLAVNDKVVIAAKAADFAMSNELTTYPQVKMTGAVKTGETIAVNDAVAVFALVDGKNAGLFAFQDKDGKYLAADMNEAPDKNALGKEDEISIKSAWKITIDANGVATVKAINADTTRNWLRFRLASEFFSCYASSYEDIAIYKAGTSTGTVEVKNYLTLSDTTNVEPPTPTKLPVPTPTQPDGSEVMNGHTIQFATVEGATVQYVTIKGDSDWKNVPANGYVLTGEDGALVELWVKATKAGRPDSDIVLLTYHIKKVDPGTPEAVATPTASPKSGKVAKDTLVTLSCATTDAEIYYTLDGSAPTKSSAKYTTPIKITGATTIKFIALKDGMTDSAVVTERYTVEGDPEAVATPTASPKSGEVAKDTLVTLSCATANAEIYYTLDGSAPTKSSAKYTTPIKITGATTIKFIAVKDGMTDSMVATEIYTVKDPEAVATPTASPKSGPVAKDTLVTLSCATADAEIYYTLDGSAPTKSSAKYTAPIKITGGTTIKFIAVKDGMTNSAVVTEGYTVSENPNPGSGGEIKNPTAPTVKAEDVKVNDGTAEIKLPSADARLDEAANKKAISANATKPLAINGGGLNIIIPAGTLTAGTDVNALLVNPKASGSVIKVTKADGTTAILPIATVSGGQAAYVANIPGKYEVIENSKTFPDANNHWALPAIGFVSARELFKGDNAGAFRPDQPMTRGMLATVLARIDGGKAAAGTPFVDVPNSSWYAKEIGWAAQNNLVEGDGKNFNPDADLTREQLCVILVRYLNYSGLDLAETTPMGDFSDLSGVSPWAKDAVEQAVKTGLIGGKTGGLLDPQGKATRAEISTILQRFVEGVLK